MITPRTTPCWPPRSLAHLLYSHDKAAFQAFPGDVAGFMLLILLAMNVEAWKYETVAGKASAQDVHHREKILIQCEAEPL